MQAIVVRHLGWTPTLPSRWKAVCAGKSKTATKGHYSDTNDHEDRVGLVKDLAKELGWDGLKITWHEGTLPNGDTVFVGSVRA